MKRFKIKSEKDNNLSEVSKYIHRFDRKRDKTFIVHYDLICLIIFYWAADLSTN